MPAPFLSALCGYRPGNGEPNISDNNDAGSKELSRALFSVLGIPAQQSAPPAPGATLESAIQADLQSRRPDLEIRRSRDISDFEQYQHLGVMRLYRRGRRPLAAEFERLAALASTLPPSGPASAVRQAIARLDPTLRQQDQLADQLLADMPEESFLKVDLTVGERMPSGKAKMLLGLSSKWSLRTDRAQDCIAQGTKLASMRRGWMPHFGVVTMEPRPAMLKIIADGSGAIDCVYHLDLVALTTTIEIVRRTKPARWQPGLTFDRLMQQQRLRDYDDLTRTLDRLPRGTG